MTEKSNSGCGGLANVTPLSVKLSGLFRSRVKNAFDASTRLLHTAAALPEDGFIGWQVETEPLSSYAFSSKNVCASKEDFNWIFDHCASASSDPPDIREDIFEGDRKVYALYATREIHNDLILNNEYFGEPFYEDSKSSELMSNAKEIYLMMKSVDAVVRVCAEKESDGEMCRGSVMISTQNEMTLRMKSMISIAFPNTVIMTADRTGGIYLPEEVFTDVAARVMSVFIENAPKTEDMCDFSGISRDLLYVDEDDADIVSDNIQFTPIEELDLSVRTFHFLKKRGILSIERLSELTDEELRAIRGIGEKCVEEVKEKLAKYKKQKEETQAENKDSMETLGGLIGLEEAKEQIRKFAAYAKLKRALSDSGKDGFSMALNMEFVGNPGTGKTTVARIIAGILYETGLLPSRDMVEAGRADIVAKYVGQTAINVKELFGRAKGKLLFIDEAYSLVDYRENDFGDEAINTIVQEMENNLDNTVVIFAGYPDKMKEFFSRNPGLRSRVPFSISFSDYSTEEMVSIAELEAKKRGFSISEEAREAVTAVCEKAHCNEEKGNGRFCRNLIENAILCYALRVFGKDDEPAEIDCILTPEDFPAQNSEKAADKTHIGFCV